MRRVLSRLVLSGLIPAVLLLPVAPTSSAATGSSDWKMLSAGTTHTCGLRTNTHLLCWGGNTAGQLGDGTQTSRAIPVQVHGSDGAWKAVSAGTAFTCAIKMPRALYCWGTDTDGQLGDQAASTQQLTPVPVVTSATSWIAVSAGQASACAIRADHTLWCWGRNAEGEVGDGTTIARSVPTKVGTATTWSSVDTAGNHTCGLRSNHRIYCWGLNDHGQLGDNGSGNATKPTPVYGTKAWSQVSTGDGFTCGRTTGDRLYCWGRGTEGELGNSDVNSASVPRQVTGNGTDWATVAAGATNACARKTDRTLWCWGFNQNGEVGDGNTSLTWAPAQVAGGDTDWSKPTGGDHACATTVTGRAYCWGLNSSSQIGDGTSTSSSRPSEVYSP